MQASLTLLLKVALSQPGFSTNGLFNTLLLQQELLTNSSLNPLTFTNLTQITDIGGGIEELFAANQNRTIQILSDQAQVYANVITVVQAINTSLTALAEAKASGKGVNSSLAAIAALQVAFAAIPQSVIPPEGSLFGSLGDIGSLGGDLVGTLSSATSGMIGAVINTGLGGLISMINTVAEDGLTLADNFATDLVGVVDVVANDALSLADTAVKDAEGLFSGLIGGIMGPITNIIAIVLIMGVVACIGYVIYKQTMKNRKKKAEEEKLKAYQAPGGAAAPNGTTISSATKGQFEVKVKNGRKKVQEDEDTEEADNLEGSDDEDYTDEENYGGID